MSVRTPGIVVAPPGLDRAARDGERTQPVDLVAEPAEKALGASVLSPPFAEFDKE